jgi:hypothetical protein
MVNIALTAFAFCIDPIAIFEHGLRPVAVRDDVD